jgi:hypothetical protein
VPIIDKEGLIKTRAPVPPEYTLPFVLVTRPYVEEIDGEQLRMIVESRYEGLGYKVIQNLPWTAEKL